MKKIMTLVITSVILTLLAVQVNAKPIYIGVKIGVFAKWQIRVHDCDDGKGLCLSFKRDNPVNFCGYDDADDRIYLKIDKKSPEAKYFTGKALIIEEDSPVDPELVKQFSNYQKPIEQTVVIKAGTYPILDSGDSYIIGLLYYLQK
jgi:hypothetical protein